jgi:LPS-assembly lipoprotein
MDRRHLLLGVSAVVLSGCGFKLREGGDFAFHKLFVNFPEDPLGVELRRHLLGTGKLELIEDPKRMREADATLDILSQQRQRVVVGVNASGQVVGVQLRLTVRFRLRDAQGVEWLEPVSLLMERDLSYAESAALSKEIEEGLTYRDMQSDIVGQIMRRLAAVRKRP